MVGEGSYSKCWLAQTEGSDSTYVIKVLPKKKLEMLVKEKVAMRLVSWSTRSESTSSCLTPTSCTSTTGSKTRAISTSSWSTVHREYAILYKEFGEATAVEDQVEREGYPVLREAGHRGAHVHTLQKHPPQRVYPKLCSLKLCNFYIDSGNVLKLGDFGFACQLAYPN